MNASSSFQRGVLLVNLGSPDSPEPDDVRRYLDQFLMDERVLDVPWLLRRLIVSLTILPKRPAAMFEAYKAIWTPEGSPLIVASRRVQQALQSRISIPVELGMRYGNPSTESAVRKLVERENIREILLIPLYPHYAISSYETAVVEARRAIGRVDPTITLIVRPPFFDDPHYITALVESAQPHLAWDYDHLLFSYHGIPERHVRKADPTGAHCLASGECCSTASPAHATCYRHQVFRTTQLFVEAAGIAPSKNSVSFQSRLGRDPWLKPYTDFEIVRLAQSGVRRMLVICPAFVSDCLETLEEIGIRAKRDFIAAGGEDLRLIPCMNDHPAWILALERWCTTAPSASGT